MNRLTFAFVLFAVSSAVGQKPEATPEHKYLQEQAGRWEATIKLVGAADAMKGTLEIKKLGDLWITSTLKADFGPLKYEGRGTKGFDPRKKKFVGSWADAITDSLALPEGTLDERTKTLTETWSQTLPDGSTSHFKLETTRDGADRMNAVYHRGASADDLKEIMTIEYVRAKETEKAK